MNIFITSTGSNTGKTVFAAGIAAVMQSLGYEMAVFKPIQVGCKYANNKQFSPDLNFVKKIDPNIKTYSSYNFKQSAIPAIAADNERVKFSMEQITRDYTEAKKDNDIVIVESTGGLLTPLSGRFTMADLAIALKIPTIIVTDVEKPDFINQTLLTIKTAELCSLNILGVIVNKYNPNETNNRHHQEIKLLEQLISYDILGYIPNVETMGEINPETLISEILQNVELPKVFDMEIPKLLF